MGTDMTTDGGTNAYPDWDEARIALGRVADLLRENDDVSTEDLQGVENYRLIPEGVRQTLENLTPEEQLLVRKVFADLASNHFYLEGGPGGLRFY
jgi:hypothetical protein